MILVTGGTGLVGSHLLFHLIQNGEKVKATYRTTDALHHVATVFGYYSDTPERLLQAITWVQADLTDIAALRSLIQDIDEVYHCAALISFDPNDDNALLKTNVEGTANLVNLCLEYGVKKLCHVSSIAALGPSDKNKGVTETTAWHEPCASAYGSSKHQAEMEVWRAAQEGLPVVIVNPGIIIGSGFWDRSSGAFFTYAAKGRTYAPPGGSGFVSAHDVVRTMIQLMKSSITQQQFIVVSEHRLYKDVLQKIATSLGKAPPLKTIPFWVLEGLWRMDWFWNKITGKKRTLTRAMVKSLYQQQLYHTTKLKNALGFEFEELDLVIDFCCSTFKQSMK